MNGMADHASATRPLKRARFAAWSVFISMCVTTMTFQVFHAIRFAHLAWPLAGLYGVVPLLIAIGILEFVSHWGKVAWWVRIGALAVMAGAMYLSASATGAVVLRAAPPHSSLLFGALMDISALLAVHFILNGPTAAAASARMAEREAELQAAADDERAAREKAENELGAVRAELAETAAKAEQAIAAAHEETETLTRKLEAATDRKRRTSTGRKRGTPTGRKSPASTGSATGAENVPDESAPDDLDREAKVLWYLDKGYSASKAGVYAGLTDSRGRQIARLKKAAPHDTVDGGEES